MHEKLHRIVRPHPGRALFCGKTQLVLPVKKQEKNNRFPLDILGIIVYAVINPKKPAMESSTSFTARRRELPIVGRRCVRLERMDSGGFF